MTAAATLLHRTANGQQFALAVDSTGAFTISVDRHTYGAGRDKMEALAAFRSTLAGHTNLDNVSQGEGWMSGWCGE